MNTFVRTTWKNSLGIIGLFCLLACSALADPPAITTPPAGTSVCAGSTVTLTVTATGTEPLTYQWYHNVTTPVGANGPSLTLNSVSAAQAGDYTVAISNAEGAVTSSPPAVLVVVALPTVTIAPAAFCAGGSGTLTAETTAANPTYLWSPGGATTASIPVSSAGTYTCTVTDGVTGCAQTASGTVTVNPLPSVTVANVSLCGGSPATMTAQTTAGNPTYLWSPGGETTASITVTTAGTYTCQVTDGNTGCVGSGSGVATAASVPSIVVSDVAICSGGTAILSASSDADPNTTYYWMPGSRTGSTIIEFPSVTTVYTVYVTNTVTKCGNSATVTVTVNPPPVVNVTADKLAICAGGNPGGGAALTASAGAGNFSYYWTPGGETTASITVTPTVTTLYTCYVTNLDTQCSGSGVANITVRDPLVVSAPADQSVCPGASPSFTVSPTGTGPFVCNWRNPSGSIIDGHGTTLALNTVSVSDAGLYSVDVIGPCQTVTLSFRLTVATPPAIVSQPVGGARMQGDDIGLVVAATGDLLTYQWYKNDVAVSGATGPSFPAPMGVTYDDIGSYYVVVNNCVGPAITSSVVEITLTGTARTGVYTDFETVGQYTNNFNQRYSGQAVSYNNQVWGESNLLGVANGRCIDQVRGTGDDNTSTYWPSPFNFSREGGTLKASMMVKWKAPANNNSALQLGFIFHTNVVNPDAAITTYSSSNASFNTIAGSAYMSFRLAPNAQPANTAYLDCKTKNLDGLAEYTPASTNTATLVPGTWYKLTVTFTNAKSASSTVYGNAVLQDMGTAGTAPGAIMKEINVAFFHPNMVTNTAVYAAFRAFENAGADQLDNFAVWMTDGPIVVTRPPASQTVLQGRSVTFSATVDGTPPYAFQWMENGADISGATKPTYTIANVTSDLDTKQYSVRVYNGTSSDTSASATLSVTAESEPPTLVSAGSVDGSRIGLRFSEAVSASTATVPGNYSTIPASTVSSVTLRPDGQSVELVLSPAISGLFTVTVNNVQDLSGNSVAANSSVNGTVLGWQATDVGGVGGVMPLTPGSTYTDSQGNFDIVAGGVDVWNAIDDGHFLLGPPKTGDFDIKVRVQKLRRPMLWELNNDRAVIAKAGIMMREDLTYPNTPVATIASNRSIQICMYPTDLGMPMGRNYHGYFWRTSVGGGQATIGTDVNYDTYRNSPAYPNAWMRLRRTGNYIGMFISSNNVNWVLRNSVSNATTWTGPMRLGLFLTSHYDAANYSVLGEFRDYQEVVYPGAEITSVELTPASTVLPAFSTLTLTPVITASGFPLSELSYEWYRANNMGVFTNMNTLPTNGTITTPMFFMSDNANLASMKWQCVVRLPGNQLCVTSTVAMITSVVDSTGPTIATAGFTPGSTNQVDLTFSEPVNLFYALNQGNYTLTDLGGTPLTLSSASLVSDTLVSTTVRLTVPSGLNLETSYRVTALNVVDRSPVPNLTPSSTFVIGAGVPMSVMVERFLNIGGGAIINLTNNPRFLLNQPDTISYTNVLGWNPTLSDAGINNFGARISAYFIPPSNGVYRFYIRADDQCLFYMNTNASNSTDPAGKTQLGLLGGYNGNYITNVGSSMIWNVALNGGQRYYTELLFTEGSGGEGVSIAYRSQGDESLPPVTEYMMNSATLRILEPPSYNQFGPVTITSITGSALPEGKAAITTNYIVTVTGGAPFSVAWFTNGVLVANQLNTLNLSVPVSSYTISSVSVVVSNTVNSASASAAISWVPDIAKPTLARAAGDGSLTRVWLRFNEAMDPVSVTNIANYSIPGLTVLKASVFRPGPPWSLPWSETNVVLETTPQIMGNVYSVSVSNLKDAAQTGNTMDPATQSFTSWVTSPSVVQRKWYLRLLNNTNNLTGGNLSVLTNHFTFTNATPDRIDATNLFLVDGPGNNGSPWGTGPGNTNNYGVVVSSYFVPPVSGNYVFYTGHDDGMQFLMNTNHNFSELPELAVSQILVDSGTRGSLATAESVTNLLLAGKRYYMEGRLKQGTGGNYFRFGAQFAWTRPGIVPGLATPTAQYLAYGLDTATPNLPTFTVTQQPASPADATEFSTVILSVRANNSSNWMQGYQWQMSNSVSGVWQDIPGAIFPDFTNWVTKEWDNVPLRAQVTIPGRATNSTVVKVHVLPGSDATKPTLVKAVGDGTLYQVNLTFSEVLDPTTARDVGNYTIPGLTVVKADYPLYPKPYNTNVVLTTSPQIQGQAYSVTVRNVKDNSFNGNVMDEASLAFSAWVISPGVIWREYYNNIGGGVIIADLTNSATYIAHTPDMVDVNNRFEAAEHSGAPDNYGLVMSGYFVTPASGDYTFFVKYDDGFDFQLSTDERPENASTLLCSLSDWDNNQGYSELKKFTVNLQGGKRYWMQARLKEGGGGDRLSIAVRTPLDPPVVGLLPAAAVDGSFLAAAADPSSPNLPLLGIAQQPVNVTAVENSYVTLSMTATNSANWIMGYLWQRWDAANSVWTNVLGASSASASFYVTWADQGASFRAAATLPGRIVYSDPVTVTITSDTTCPTVVAVAGSVLPNVITVTFDEAVDPASATNPQNYTFSGGLAISDASMIDSKSVMLHTATAIPSGSYTLTVANINDIAHNPNQLCGGSVVSASFSTPWLTSAPGVQADFWYNLNPAYNGTSGSITYWDFRDLTNKATFPYMPDYSTILNISDWPQTGGASPGIENYGMRMIGTIIPPVSGFYTFYLNADDATRFTIGPAGPATGGTIIQEATGSCAACAKAASYSRPINLVGGLPYSFEVLFTEGTGGDYMHLQWLKPGATSFDYIYSTNLTGWSVNQDAVQIVINPHPASVTVLEGRHVSFTSRANGGVAPALPQWQVDDGSGWVDMPNETNAVLDLGYVCLDKNLFKYRVRYNMSAFNGLITRTSTSDEATLTVLEDVDPPFIVSVGSLDGDSIGVVFNEPIRMDENFVLFDNWEIQDANIAANLYYTNADGTCQTDEYGECVPTFWNFPVARVQAWPDTNAIYTDKIILKLAGHFTPNVSGPFSVHCYYAVDTACRMNSLDSLADSVPIGQKQVDIWSPLPAGDVFVGSSNTIHVTAGGSDIWNSGDQFTYVYQPVNGDFDARVTVVGIPDPPAAVPNTWVKAGLMVRGYIEGTDGVNVGPNYGDATNSLMAYMVATATNGVNVFAGGIRYANLMGAADLGSSARQTITGIYPSNAFPVQVRMVREGDFINGYYWGYTTNYTYVTNEDLTVTTTMNTTPDWVLAGSGRTTNWPANLFIGEATTSHQQGMPVSATYRDFMLVERPTITVQPTPASLILTQGQTLILSVEGTGPANGGAMRYQWYLATATATNPVVGATSSTLTLTNVTLADAGAYFAEVRNSAGAVYSTATTLEVWVPPTISVQPANQTIPCFGGTTFSVSALGDAPISYQWYTNGVPIDGAISDTLSVFNVEPSMAGPYWVVLSNRAGVVESAHVSLTLSDTVPPVINCPAPIAMQCPGVVNFIATAANGCGFVVPVICVPPSGTSFAAGVTTVNCTATDPVGGPATCSFTVTVADTLAPVFTCPADITVTATGTVNVVTWSALTATDNCGGTLPVTCTPASGSEFAVGTNTVVCEAFDASLNTNTCSFKVIVQEEAGPISLSISVDHNTGLVTVTWPKSPAGYTLKTSPSLGTTPAADWQNYTGTIDDAGANWSVTVSPTGKKFFRLEK